MSKEDGLQSQQVIQSSNHNNSSPPVTISNELVYENLSLVVRFIYVFSSSIFQLLIFYVSCYRIHIYLRIRFTDFGKLRLQPSECITTSVQREEPVYMINTNSQQPDSVQITIPQTPNQHSISLPRDDGRQKRIDKDKD